MRAGKGRARVAEALLVVGGLALLGSREVTPETLAAAPAPVPVLAQGVTGIAAFGAERVTFPIATDGSLEASVDWSNAENDVDLYLVAGDCSLARLTAGECSMLAFSESMSAKPERLVVRLPRGVYTLGVLSQDPRAEELRWRIALR